MSKYFVRIVPNQEDSVGKKVMRARPTKPTPGSLSQGEEEDKFPLPPTKRPVPYHIEKDDFSNLRPPTKRPPTKQPVPYRIEEDDFSDLRPRQHEQKSSGEKSGSNKSQKSVEVRNNDDSDREMFGQWDVMTDSPERDDSDEEGSPLQNTKNDNGESDGDFVANHTRSQTEPKRAKILKNSRFHRLAALYREEHSDLRDCERFLALLEKVEKSERKPPPQSDNDDSVDFSVNPKKKRAVATIEQRVVTFLKRKQSAKFKTMEYYSKGAYLKQLRQEIKAQKQMTSKEFYKLVAKKGKELNVPGYKSDTTVKNYITWASLLDCYPCFKWITDNQPFFKTSMHHMYKVVKAGFNTGSPAARMLAIYFKEEF